MAKPIQWEVTRYGGHRGSLRIFGKQVEVAMIDRSTKRGDGRWFVRVDLPGWSASDEPGTDLDAAKATAQHLLNAFAKDIS
jgi:hypothetical protein